MDFIRRKTRQREQVLEAVHHLGHPTAQETYAHLTKSATGVSGPAMSLGTIYRNLQVLEEEGKIIPVPTDNEAMRYDARLDAHYHMLCEKCGRVFDLPIAYNDSLDFEAERQSEFKIESHSILFKGICKNCL
jgi:Fur family peroxide stress response transcriptional regulator